VSPENPSPPVRETKSGTESPSGTGRPQPPGSGADKETSGGQDQKTEQSGGSDSGEPLFDTKIGTNFGPINFQALSGTPARQEAQFDEWDAKRLSQLWEDLVPPNGEIERIVARLRSRRFLVITGPRELGKTSMVLLAAAWMLRNPDSSTCEVAALCRGLQTATRLDMDALAGRKPDFRGRLIVIDRAFAQLNEDLIHFIAELDDLRLISLDERLRKAGSFLVLVDDAMTSGVASQLEKLQRLKLVEQLSFPDPEELSQWLSFLAQRLLRSVGDEAVRRSVEVWLREPGQLLVGRLKTLPRLARFVREYLQVVASGTLTLDQALERIETPESWFMEELPQDLDAWCAVIALTLCSAAPPVYETSWLQFDLVRRNVIGRILWETRQRRPATEASHLCGNQGLFSRARAEVVNHRIRFQEPRLAQELWRVLLQRGRDLVTVLLPLLRELARSEDFPQRQIAAWALGRIGQIDAPHVIWPLIEQWSTGPHARRDTLALRGALLGSLLQGALGAEEHRDYRAGCLAILDRLLADTDDATSATALISLAHLAIVDWELAVPRLLRFAEVRLPLDWTAVRDLQDDLLAHEEALRKRRPSAKTSRALRDLPEIAELKFIAGLLTPEKFPLCNAFSHVVGELVEMSPRKAFSALRAWAATDRRQCGPLVALLLFHRNGILSVRAGAPSAEDFDGEDLTRTGGLLGSLVADEGLLVELGEFLIEIYAAFSSFPGILRGSLERSFDQLLAAWARTAQAAQSALPAVGATVSSLLASLFAAENRELSERIFGYTRSGEQEGDLAALRSLTLEAFANRR